MHICNNFIFIFNMKENHGVKIDNLKLMKTLSQLVLRLGKIQYGKKTWQKGYNYRCNFKSR